MSDEVKVLAREIEKMICHDCNRVEVDCRTCPVQRLADMCRVGKKKRERNKEVTRTLISMQQFEYLCDVGVVTGHTGSSDLVVYPYNMKPCSLLKGNMTNDLLKDTPWQIKYNTETGASPDTRVDWCIPEWLFMENQVEILKAYFGRE